MTPNARPHRLVIEESGHREIYEILEDTLVVGRDAACAIQLQDHKISRRHAEIVRRDGVLHIRDLESSNGTLVNGLPIFRATALADGDKIDLGGNSILWVTEARTAMSMDCGEPATAAAAAPQLPSGHTPPPSNIDRTPVGDRSPRAAHSSRARLIVGTVTILAIGVLIVLRSTQNDSTPGTGATATPVTPERSEVKPPDEVTPFKQAEPLQPKLPVDTEADLLRDFELAITDARFGAATYVLQRLGQDRRGALKTRLDTAIADTAGEVQEQAARLESSQGKRAAADFIKLQLADFPAASGAHTQLTAILLGLTRKPATGRPVVAKNNAKRETPPDEAPFKTARKPIPPDVLKKAGEEVASADKALGEHRFKAAEARYRQALALLKDVHGPNRHRRHAERGIRRVAAQLGFVDSLISSAGTDPGRLGRIPHISGQSSKVIRIDHSGVTFVGTSGPLRVAWRVLPQRAFIAILDKAPLDAESMVDAVSWLREYGADEEAEKLLVRAYKKDEAVKPRIDQALADGRQIPLPEAGFALLDGQWYSPREVARKRLNDLIEKSVKIIGDDDADARADAIAVLMGLGDAARSSLYRALLMQKAHLKERLANGKAAAAMSEVGDLRAGLEEARASALELIFDTEKYPYPYRPPGASQAAFEQYRTHQPIVDKRVAAIRKIWNDERSAGVPDFVHEIISEIRQLNRAIRESGFGEPTADPAAWMMHLPAQGERLTIRNVAMSEADRTRIEKAASVMKRNAANPGEATRGEISQCLITNEYRVMMGRWAVRLYDPLVNASHGHCADMSRLGFFSHTSPVAGKRTPFARIVKAGMAPSGASENIAINRGPLGAHNAWVHSPGHHRNILGRSWRLMGPGNVGRYWCQNFTVSDRNVPDAYDK
ncbi:MAG: FHA domain-containing protein [Planctomycetota bacterium]|nr:FHA domain-containing protein [Planctomycetota bacterium]